MRFASLSLFFLLLLGLTGQVFSRSAADKSQILYWITNTGTNIINFDGISFGWDWDDLLISEQWTMTYPFGSTNSISNLNTVRIPPSINTNVGELGDDSKYPNRSDIITHGELHGMWFTWDTNGVYFAVVGESKGRANNLFIVFDRLAAVGSYKFGNMNSGWKRNINFSDWEPDLYIGMWGQDNQPTYGGSQLWRINNCVPETGITTVWNMLAAITTSDSTGTNFYRIRYNSEETDITKRVMLGFITWAAITNGMNPIDNMILKTAAVSSGPDDGSPTYDFCPDNLGGVDPNNASTFTENNFQMVVFTNGSVNTNYSPAMDGKVVVIPGTKIIANIIPTNFTNPLNSFGDLTSYLVPDLNDRISFSIPDFDSIGYLGNAKVSVFDLYGRKVRTVYDGYESIKPDNVTNYLSFDGKNDTGEILGTGTYLYIVSGNNPVGSPIKLKYIINIIR